MRTWGMKKGGGYFVEKLESNCGPTHVGYCPRALARVYKRLSRET